MKCPCCDRPLDPQGDLVVSLETNTVTFRGIAKRLQPRRIEVLKVLADSMPRAVTAEALISKVFGLDEPDNARNAIAVHISLLRKDLLPLGLTILTYQKRSYILSTWSAVAIDAVRRVA